MWHDRAGAATIDAAWRLAALVLCMGLSAPAPALATAPYETGGASWYGGKRHHGRATASGRPFNQWGTTAAHRSLPFGTRVRIRNLTNGRTADVTIADRGPFIRGRVIDVSRHTADALGMTRAGVARVELRVMP